MAKKADRVERSNGARAAGNLHGRSSPLPKEVALRLIEALAILGEDLPLDVTLATEVGGSTWVVDYEIDPCQHPEALPTTAGAPNFDGPHGPDDGGYIGDGRRPNPA